MSSAGRRPSWQAMVSVGTSIVPPGRCPPPENTPGISPAVTAPQLTASLHDFAVSLVHQGGDLVGQRFSRQERGQAVMKLPTRDISPICPDGIYFVDGD